MTQEVGKLVSQHRSLLILAELTHGANGEADFAISKSDWTDNICGASELYLAPAPGLRQEQIQILTERAMVNLDAFTNLPPKLVKGNTEFKDQ